mmetsp:Transcript_18424/g.27592  ORF Transcript_18424/g.27592 Transcript_18424/m.27592 type:complete len:87 (-) Transcript_18424:43-303(-)
MDCAFSPDGKLAISASHDSSLILWRLRDGRRLKLLYKHRYGVLSCAMTSNLALSGDDEISVFRGIGITSISVSSRLGMQFYGAYLM